MHYSDHPYWFSESIPHRYLSRLTPVIHSTLEDERIVIIGGGLSGVLLAYFLACHKTCASIVLIEEREICGSSSGRMGGHFWPIGPCPPHSLSQSLDLATTRQIYQFGYDAFDDFSNFLQSRPGMASDIRFVAGKGLDLFSPKSLVDDWQSSISKLCPIMQARGAKILSQEQIMAEYGIQMFENDHACSKFDGGLYDPNACQLSPVLLAVYLLDLIEKMCAESNGSITFTCLPKTKVTHLARNSSPGPRFLVDTHLGDKFSAKSIVHCTNLMHTHLLPFDLNANYSPFTVSPIRGQMIVTQPVQVSPPFTHIGSLCYNSFNVYMTRILSKDGATCRYLVGGQSNAEELDNRDDMQTTSKVTSRLESFIRCLLGAPDLQMDYQYSGIMGVSPDSFPIVGQLKTSPGEWVAFGTSPAGMVHLWGLSQALAAEISGMPCPKLSLPNSYRLDRFTRASH